MTIKEYIQELSKLDQNRRIVMTNASHHGIFAVDPKIEKIHLTQYDQFMRSNSEDFVYEISAEVWEL